MASKIALGFSAWLVGDNTTSPVTVDLTKDPVFFFSPDPVTNVSQTSSAALIPLDRKVSSLFDIIKNPPTGVSLGSYTIINNYPYLQLSGSNFGSPSVNGYTITATPNSAFTGIGQIVGVLTFD